MTANKSTFESSNIVRVPDSSQRREQDEKTVQKGSSVCQGLVWICSTTQVQIKAASAGVSRLLAALGSPAATPKPCGRSRLAPEPAIRYPAINKATKKPRKKAATTAKAA